MAKNNAYELPIFIQYFARVLQKLSEGFKPPACLQLFRVQREILRNEKKVKSAARKGSSHKVFPFFRTGPQATERLEEANSKAALCAKMHVLYLITVTIKVKTRPPRAETL